MTDGNDIGRLFSQVIAQIGGIRIGDNYGLTAFYPETRKP
jgi:hypothetical protein